MHQLQTLYYSPLTNIQPPPNRRPDAAADEKDDANNNNDWSYYRCSVNSAPLVGAAPLSSFSESPASSAAAAHQSAPVLHCSKPFASGSSCSAGESEEVSTINEGRQREQEEDSSSRIQAVAATRKQTFLQREQADDDSSSRRHLANAAADPNFLSVWTDEGDDYVDNSAAVARLSKDFDLMFDSNGDKTVDQCADSTTPNNCCRQCETDQCSRRLELSCLTLSVITFIVALLLAIQTIAVQQFGSSILCLVGSLVFLFLIFLQKKGLKPGTAVGCVIASLSVAALSLVVFAVWARDLVLLFSAKQQQPSSPNLRLSYGAEVATGGSPIIEVPQTLVDVVEARLFPNPRPQLWGCFPMSTENNNNGPEILPIAFQDLSIGCVTSQTLLGLLSSISACSSIGVAIVSIWMCVRFYKQHRRDLKNTSSADVWPTRLQRTVSTPVVFNETGFSTESLN